MALSEARKRANEKYNAKNYEQIQVRVKIGKKAEIKASAEGVGLSVNEFINAAIDEKMERDNAAAE